MRYGSPEQLLRLVWTVLLNHPCRNLNWKYQVQVLRLRELQFVHDVQPGS